MQCKYLHQRYVFQIDSDFPILITCVGKSVVHCTIHDPNPPHHAHTSSPLPITPSTYPTHRRTSTLHLLLPHPTAAHKPPHFSLPTSLHTRLSTILHITACTCSKITQESHIIKTDANVFFQVAITYSVL